MSTGDNKEVDGPGAMSIFREISGGCVKGLLIGLNLLCILIGLCTFGFAVVDIKILDQYGDEQTGGCYVGDVIIIVASLLLVAVATFGCVGTAWGRVKMLNLYVGFILIMVILEMLIAIYVSLQRYGLQFRITNWIREDFYKNVTVSDIEAHSKLWSDLQATYECCGLNGPDDYLALGQHIPLSCCSRAYGARSEKAKKLMHKSCVETATFYKSGCEYSILSALQSDTDFLIGVAVIFFWFEALCILLSMWVTRHLKNSVQVYKDTVKY